MAGSNRIVPGFSQWLKLRKEATFGVYDAAGTDVYLRITGDAGFTMAKNKIRTTIRSADAQNRRLSNISAKYAVAGALNTPLYPAYAQVILDMACKLDATYHLDSYSIDYFDGQTPRRHLGCMVQSLNVSSSSDQQYANCALSFLGSRIDDTITFAQPDPAVFTAQTVPPFLHTELAGKFKKAGAAVQYFSQFDLSIENLLQAKHYEAEYVGWAAWCGRNVNLSSQLAYINTDWRDVYESQAPQTLEATFYRDAGTALKLDFKTVNFVGSRNPSRALGDVMEESLGIEAFYDEGNSTDFNYTVTYTP